jgi:hypothetical protein
LVKNTRKIYLKKKNVLGRSIREDKSKVLVLNGWPKKAFLKM